MSDFRPLWGGDNLGTPRTKHCFFQGPFPKFIYLVSANLTNISIPIYMQAYA